MRSVVIIGRKSIERMLGLLCIIAATLIFGMSVKAAGPEEVAYVYLDEDVVGTSGVQNIVVGFQKEEMVIGVPDYSIKRNPELRVLWKLHRF